MLVVKAYDTEWNKIHDVDMEISKHKKTKIRKMVKYWKNTRKQQKCGYAPLYRQELRPKAYFN